MTIRVLIDRKKRGIMLVALLGFAVGAAGAILAQQGVLNIIESRFAMLSGIAVFLLALFYANTFAFRCPQCRAYWESLAMSRSFFAIDRRIRYCPFCGRDIDTELDAE